MATCSAVGLLKNFLEPAAIAPRLAFWMLLDRVVLNISFWISVPPPAETSEVYDQWVYGLQLTSSGFKVKVKLLVDGPMLLVNDSIIVPHTN